MFDHEQVLQFWYQELDRPQWWMKDENIDNEIHQRFGDYLTAAIRCELYYWRSTAEGRLAEIIVLDQFSRNIHRDSAHSFSSDPLALALAQEAIFIGSHENLNADQKAFLYIPYMHSESLLIHDISVELHSAPGLEVRLEWEHKHRNIIVQFGRYPHRNQILGRISTPEELAFLENPGSSF